MGRPTKLGLLSKIALLGALSCRAKPPGDLARGGGSSSDARPQSSSVAATAIDVAEDVRRGGDIPPSTQRERDPAIRRRAARAFSRILGDDAPLLRALDDDDPATIAWAGYGLGQSCKGREDGHVRALVARFATLGDRPPGDSLDPRAVITRALGQCGGDAAEQTLRALLDRGGTNTSEEEAVAYALGDLAAKRGSLSFESATALLDAAARTPPLDAALYPFGRVEGWATTPLGARVIDAARSALSRPGPLRIFAVRAVGRCGQGSVAPDLGRVLSSSDFTAAERAEAARSLGRLHEAGQSAIAQSLPVLWSARSDWDGLFGVLLTAIKALGTTPPKTAEATLWAIARAERAPGLTPPLLRRLSALRCAAAVELARGAWDSDVLLGCDLADGEAGQRARLEALDRGPLVNARRAAWLEIVRRAVSVRVREDVIDSIARHPELSAVGRSVLSDGLVAAEPGVVAVAARVVAAHPERAYALAEREKRAALDPRAPPPTSNPAQVLDPVVAAALRTALARPWAEDLVETRAALVDAALAVNLDEGRQRARDACRDPNATVRARAAKALAATGQAEGCTEPEEAATPAPEIGRIIGKTTRVDLETDAGTLVISLDPSFAPIAVTRFVALARSGFYTGVSLHRVVPGFVVQFGDHDGDGYGGAGQLLRCETSPLAFGAMDVGVALAGRDTGSSQLFVALARNPHLDGQYAWVGRAGGDWNAVAEGDRVQAVHVEE